jgi:hypothetical protein
MQTVTLILAAGLVLDVASTLAVESTPPKTPVRQLEPGDAAPSRDALVEQFLAALATRDADGLKRLRVTEREYRDVILPGSAKEGEALRKYSDEQAKFFWSLLDTKSVHFEAALLSRYGGRRYRVKTVEYERGERQYAAYRAFKQLRLVLIDESGAERELATGSIAEIEGHYKFISYVRD